MVALHYRRASIDDLPLLYRLAREIWIPAFAPLFSKKQLEALYKGMYNDELLTEWLSAEGNEMYFIYEADKAIGYAAIEKKGDALKLDKIYIHPDLQGAGRGSEVMYFIEQRAKELQAKEITLRVNRGNDSAIRFYQNRGFEIERSIDFPGPDGYLYEDYLMTKIIA